jgi:hypothetical protein
VSREIDAGRRSTAAAGEDEELAKSGIGRTLEGA